MYDDVTGAVVRWHDRSGNGRDLVQSSAVNRPIYSATAWNGDKPSVTFDGTTSVMERSPWPTENPIGAEEPFTVLAVVKPTEVRDASIATWWGTNGLVGAWLKAQDDELVLLGRRTGTYGDFQEFQGTAPTSTHRQVLAFRYERTTENPPARKLKLSVNGVTEEMNVSPLSAMVGDRFLVGWQYPGGGTKFKGQISELVVVPRSISEQELAAFQTYAETEWEGFGSSGNAGDSCNDASDCGAGLYCASGICCKTSCTSENTCVTALECVNLGEAPEDRGICLGVTLEDGEPCDDGNSSTSDDECQSGECVGGAWSPSSLSPTVWFEASPEYIVDAGGGAVSQWADRSGNGHHVLQANACCRPVYSAAGWNDDKPTLTFNGTSSVLDRNPWPSLTPIGNESPYTVLAVMKPSGVQSGALASWWGTGGLVGAWLHAENGNLFLRSRRVGVYGGDRIATDTANLATGRHVVAYSYATGVYTFTVDGVTLPNPDPAPVDPVSSMIGGSGNNQLLIGWQDAWGTAKFKGDISEIVVVPSRLSQTELDNFRTYAQLKWGGLGQ
jgi:hypothetical protein